MRYRFLLAVPACICLMLACSISATATDFSPPPWDRLSEAATYQEWEFLTAPNNLPFGEGLAPDGASVGTNNPGARAIPIGLGVTLIGGMDGTFAWVDGFGATPGVGAGVIRFEIPNRPDELPNKRVRVQVEYAILRAGGIPPGGLTDFISDPPGATFTPVQTLDVSGDTDPLRDFRLFTFEIQPNPAFESFVMLVPSSTAIDEVIIDTISEIPIPEPATGWLFVVGALLVGRLLRRARQSPSAS